MRSNIIIRKKYVEIEIPDEEDRIEERNRIKDKISLEKDLQSLEKDLQIPLEDGEFLLNDMRLRLGKMCIQDIAYDLDIKVSIAKKYRKKILDMLDVIQKEIVLCQERKIEKLRKAILAGEMKRRPHNHTFGVEGLIRGIVRDLTRQGKSIKEIVEQTHLETSTISYHRRKIKEKYKRKYPPRIMNMTPGKEIKVKLLLEKNKKQKDICNVLNISSATASVIVGKIKTMEVKRMKIVKIKKIVKGTCKCHSSCT